MMRNEISRQNPVSLAFASRSRFRWMPLAVLAASLFFITHKCPAADEVIFEADLRDATAADGNEYFVVLCARPMEVTLTKSPLTLGHTWGVWAKHDEQAKASVIDMIYGFWPEGGKKLLIAPAPGQILKEATKPALQADHNRMSHRVILKVNKTQYDRSLKVADNWTKAKAKYDLTFMNCTHYIADVASSLDINVQVNAAEKPTAYIDRIIDALKAMKK